MGGVLCHGQRPSLMWKDVHCGVIRYNALLDDAGQQHVMEERCLLPEEAAGTLSHGWTCAVQPPQSECGLGERCPHITEAAGMARHHRERHRTGRIGWLRAAVLGANDGIVSTASLVLGMAAAQATHSNVVVAGVAGLVAGPCRWPPGSTCRSSLRPTPNRLNSPVSARNCTPTPKASTRS